MNRIVALTLLVLACLVGTALTADDVQARGHGRRAAGCGGEAYAEEAGCAGGHGDGWYFGKRRHERRARRAARHAAYVSYGCEGEAAASYGCEGAPPASCSEPAPQQQYVPETVMPASYQSPAPQVRQPTGHYETRRVCRNGRCTMTRVWVEN